MLRSPVARSDRRLVAVALSAVLLTCLLPVTTSAAGGSAPATTSAAEADAPTGAPAEAPVVAAETATQAPADGLRPTIQYEEAMAHAGDRTRFEAGARVSVAFRPRPGDHWTVDGLAPRSLPAGRLSGGALRTDATDPIVEPAPAPIDRPAADRSAIPADMAVFDPAGGPPTATLTAAVDPGALRREVFGFLPYWELTDSSTRLDWEKISTVAYFGVGADRNGNLVKRNADGSTTVGWSGWTSTKMTSVIDAAHRSHARVVLTVQSFAWSSGGLAAQKALLGSATARSRLASQIVAAVRDRGADGANLDFEPIASGYADEFTALVRLVRSRLTAAARGYQLTFDTTGWIGNYPIEAATASGGADAIFIMGYDYRSASSSPVGSIAPAGGPSYDVADTVAAYAARVPASRLILGVPYYGRAWSTATDLIHAKNTSSARTGASAAVTYDVARDYLDQYGRRWDSVERVSWTAYRRQNCTASDGCVTSWRQLYVDDVTALKSKYDLVNRYDLRGAGIWALGYDGTRPELYQALEDMFITDSVPPVIRSGAVSASAFSPDGDGRIDTTTATLSATGLTTWGYLVKPITGSTLGAAIRSGSRTGTSPSFTWDGTGPSGVAPDGPYRITVWASDVSGNRAERSFDVRLDTRRPTITPSASNPVYSPDGDGWYDAVTLRWAGSERVTGTARVMDSSNAVVRRWTFASALGGATSWAGTSTSGAAVPDGRYVFRVDAADAAGNRTVTLTPVAVDRTIRAVGWSTRSFDPRAGQSARLSMTFRRAAKVRFDLYRGSTLVRTGWTGSSVVAGTYGWTWNGRTSAGAWLPAGHYRVVVRASSWLGTTVTSRPITVAAH